MIWPYLKSLRGALDACKDISEPREPRSDSAMAIRTGRTYLKALVGNPNFQAMQRIDVWDIYRNSQFQPQSFTSRILGASGESYGRVCMVSMGESMAVLTAENLSARVEV